MFLQATGAAAVRTRNSQSWAVDQLLSDMSHVGIILVVFTVS